MSIVIHQDLHGKSNTSLILLNSQWLLCVKWTAWSHGYFCWKRLQNNGQSYWKRLQNICFANISGYSKNECDIESGLMHTIIHMNLTKRMMTFLWNFHFFLLDFSEKNIWFFSRKCQMFWGYVELCTRSLILT